MTILAAVGAVLMLPERHRDVRRGIAVHHDPRLLPRPGAATHRRQGRRWRPAAIISALILLFAFAIVGPAGGQVPTAVDFATCNGDAAEAVKAGTASPTTVDHARAGHARDRAVTTASPSDADGASTDPQIRGMDAEGAKHAAYQAAYRSCMRRKGF